MTRIARLAGWMIGTAAVTLLLTPVPAAATRPAPDGPTQPQTVVQRVEVPIPVPVDDATVELIQMGIAAALGASIAAGATATRLRRRLRSTAIDITDTRSVALPSQELDILSSP